VEIVQRLASRIFYGWYVVAAAFTVMLLGFAAAYSFSAFFTELQREFDMSRAGTALIFSVGGALYFGLGAISGPLSDRYGPRWICVFGFVVLGAGLGLASIASDLTMVYIGFGLGIGVGVGFSYVPAIGAVQPWFTKRRGFASGLAVSGIGVGTLLGPIIASVIIAAFGWRVALASIGTVVMVAGIAAALVLDNKPERYGSAQSRSSASAAAPDDSFTLKQALRTKPFWLLYLSAACLSFALFVPFVHLVPYALDHSLSARSGALLIGMVGIGSTVGRFLVGALADRLGRLNVFVMCFVGVACTFFLWLLSAEFWLLGLFALTFGSFYGGFVALLPALTVDYFGTRAAAGTIGVLYSSVGIGTLLGPPFAGFIFDEFSSYAYAIVAGELMACVAVAIAMCLPEPQQHTHPNRARAVGAS
jgi:MFS family permease